MRFFEASELFGAMRKVYSQALLVFESTRDPHYKRSAVTLLRNNLREVQEICESHGLKMSAMHAQSLLETIDTSDEGLRLLSDNVAPRIPMMLSETIQNELSLHTFMALPEVVREYVQNENGFGGVVQNAFPSTWYDLVEANRCFGYGLYTACVFHLMRALEKPLGVFAERFAIKSEHTNWQTVIEQIEKKIKAIPSDPNRAPYWKDEYEFFQQAASTFMVIKDAWRNYTAHSRAKYTEMEANLLMMNTRAFLEKLATRFSEDEDVDRVPPIPCKH